MKYATEPNRPSRKLTVHDCAPLTKDAIALLFVLFFAAAIALPVMSPEPRVTASVLELFIVDRYELEMVAFMTYVRGCTTYRLMASAMRKPPIFLVGYRDLRIRPAGRITVRALAATKARTDACTVALIAVAPSACTAVCIMLRSGLRNVFSSPSIAYRPISATIRVMEPVSMESCGTPRK